jgi:peptidoglycan/LPS O-acetylase OafA/YrhL
VSHKRADIQGLRALAVLSVVAFHAGLPLPGGFTGVDVFFVISGYVITNMLRREHAATGRIAFGAFYLRRFRRLAPALSVVVAFTVAGSSLVLSPLGPQEDVAKTALGALLFVANFAIASTTGGYFDRAADANPLLHTWSLSVEEQFYFLFPALLVVGWRLRRSGAVVGAVTALSLAVALTGGGFYYPLSRAWEFGVGALLTLATVRSPRVALAASALGIEMLLVSFVLLDGDARWPSPWTLLPVAGAGLLLLGAPKALALPPLARIGDWSYSLYLWHWPLIVFAVALWPATPHVRLYAAAASVVPALLSFRFVEQPLRTLRIQPARRLALLAAAVLALPLLVDGAMASTVKGVWTPGYQAADLLVAHDGEIGEADFYRSVARYPACGVAELRVHALRFENVVRCGQSQRTSPAAVALIGDSHAEHLFPGLAAELHGTNVLYDIVDDAPTLDDADFARIVRDVVSRPSIRTVVVSAFWHQRHVVEAAQLVPVLRALHGKQVFVTDDVPSFPFDAAACKYRTSVLQPSRCSAPATPSNVAIATAAREAGAHVLHTTDLLCGAQTCGMVKDGRLLYRDWNHLNADGSRYVAEAMLRDPLFARATADPRRPRR